MKSAHFPQLANLHLDVLVVEDDRVQAARVRKALASGDSCRIDVSVVETLSSALRELAQRSYDVVVLDLGLPDSEGIATFHAVRAVVPSTAIVVLSSMSVESLAAAAVRDGAQDYLLKSHADRTLLLRSVVYAFHRQAASLQLQWSRARFRAVFENALDAIFVCDDHGYVTDANSAATKLMGISLDQMCGLAFTELFESEIDLGALWNRFLAAGSTQGELKFVTSDQVRHSVEYSAAAFVVPGMHVWTLHDITDRQALAAELFRSRQMDSLGRLAAGVAHDFNNILMVIASYCELLRSKVQDPTVQRYTSQIAVATDRGTSLTKQMLSFCRDDGTSSVVTDLNLEITESLRMISRVLGEDIEIRLDLSSEKVMVHSDAGAMGQVMLNLAINARDAMPGGGILAITTRSIRSAERTHAEPRLKSGQTYVCLTVSDNGTGMTEDVRERAFEPFFTTKHSGQGTGLGLSTVYGIVHSMGGVATVLSSPGKGSTFELYLPCIQAPQEPMVLREQSQPENRAGGRILLVEDEAAIRIALQEELTELGYDVVTASCGDEAIRQIRNDHLPVQVVITDVVMPKMNGRELVDALKAIQPIPNVIYMTGYSGTVLERQGIPQGVHLLRKPFSLAALQAKIAECQVYSDVGVNRNA